MGYDLLFWFFCQVDNACKSLDLQEDGWSFRKIAALHGIWVSIVCTIKFSSAENFIMVLVIWLCFVLICMALLKPETITEFISRKNNNPNQ